MNRSVLVLACAALVLTAFTPLAAQAAQTEGSQAPAAPAADRGTVEPEAPLSLDPAGEAQPAGTYYPNCDDDDVTGTTFFNEPDPQPCMDYCASNGWSFIEYGYLGRGYYICTCCAG